MNLIPALIGAALAGAFGTLLWSGVVPEPMSLHAMLLTGIAWVYIGYALIDGRFGNTVIEGVGAVVFTAAAFVGRVGRCLSTAAQCRALAFQFPGRRRGGQPCWLVACPNTRC